MNQKGISVVALIITAVIVGSLGFVVFNTYKLRQAERAGEDILSGRPQLPEVRQIKSADDVTHTMRELSTIDIQLIESESSKFNSDSEF